MTDLSSSPPEPTSETASPAYQVLARKYRPQSFDALIGQDAMVRTLSNAIAENRIAHAFILTGVRGVGKTTTARIIARALNCTGADGNGGPTVTPCGVCDACVGIAESRHVDVLEMDAASRTGVDNMRELLDGVRYLPVSARYKVYIIDEVHMLSTAAFNALLKTLEEPPAHVKFIFATTEIRKVPVTVLSRCQRFDLRRIEPDALVAHFAHVLEQEGATADDEALRLIARAADGSARDGLSLLDQAIAHAGGKVDAGQVRDMLGLADRAQVFDLFDAVMAGDAARALTSLKAQYDLGADPAVVLQDMLELTHWLTRLKLTPDVGDDVTVSAQERARGGEMAGRLSMPVLARAWQMLLKGLGEVRVAPTPLAAAEMILVRLTYSADLPPPGDLVARLQDDPAAARAPATPTVAAAPAPSAPVARASKEAPPAEMPSVEEPPSPIEPPPADMAPAEPAPSPAPPVDLRDFTQLAALAEERKQGILFHHISDDVHLVGFGPGRLEFRPGPNAPANLAVMLKSFAEECTGESWVVTINNEADGAPTLAEQRRAAAVAAAAEIEGHPLVRATLDAFPGSEIGAVRDMHASGADEGDAGAEPEDAPALRQTASDKDGR